MQRTLPLKFARQTRAFSSTPRAALARMSLIGRLASVPEFHTTPSGVELVRYTVGTNHGKPGTESEGVSWFRVASFDDGARRDLLMALPKGTLVHVDAESRMRLVEDGERKRGELSLIQRSIEVLSRPKNANLDDQAGAAASAGAEAGDEAVH